MPALTGDYFLAERSYANLGVYFGISKYHGHYSCDLLLTSYFWRMPVSEYTTETRSQEEIDDLYPAVDGWVQRRILELMVLTVRNTSNGAVEYWDISPDGTFSRTTVRRLRTMKKKRI